MFDEVPVYSTYFMYGVLAILSLATIILLIMKKAKPESDFSEPLLRTKSWWWMIAIVFTALSVSQSFGIVFVAFLSYLALKEYLSIVPFRVSDRSMIIWCYLSIPFQYLWVSMEWYGMFIIFIPVYVFLYLPVVNVIRGDTEDCIRSTGVIHWALMMTVFCLSHMAYLLVLEPLNQNAGAIGLILFLLVMTQANDVSQYVWGKAIGKRKIIPQVSPNKTVEGFIGGVITVTVISAFLAPWVTPLNVYESVVAGLIISLSGFTGDVVMSAIKRDLKIKDTGRLIPGHGGILDRMDSLLFTTPLFFHYVYYLYY